jgi:hypothetical protein
MTIIKLTELLHDFLKETQLGLQIYKPAFFLSNPKNLHGLRDQEAPPLPPTFDIPSLLGLDFVSGRALLELPVGGGIKPTSMR